MKNDPFSEATTTLVLNAHGALLLLATNVAATQTLSIAIPVREKISLAASCTTGPRRNRDLRRARNVLAPFLGNRIPTRGLGRPQIAGLLRRISTPHRFAQHHPLVLYCFGALRAEFRQPLQAL